MKMKPVHGLLFFLLLCSCMKRKYADLVIHNAHIYTLDENNSMGEAMAIDHGKVVEVGPERQILNKYRWGKSIDAEQRFIYPGFTDALGHYANKLVNNRQSAESKQRAFESQWLTLQQDLLRNGIVEVHDAGMDADQLQQLMRLDHSGKLNVRVYTMLNPSDENFRFAEKLGIYTSRNLTVRSFYLTSSKDIKLSRRWVEQWAQRCTNLKYQLVFYPRDSAEISWFWKVARKAYQVRPDHRWRLMVDNASVYLNYSYLKDFAVFVTVFPIATTEKKIEENKVDCRAIMEGFGILALASNFSMNSWSSMNVQQKLNHFPPNTTHKIGHLSMTFQERLKALTVWPQFAAFHESIRGSLSKGFEANFFIAERPINSEGMTHENAARMTFIQGKLVYDATK